MSFFASKTLTRHLLRGAAAAVFIALAVKINVSHPGAAVLAGIGALIMLRGCPLCWTMGLIETVVLRDKHVGRSGL